MHISLARSSGTKPWHAARFVLLPAMLVLIALGIACGSDSGSEPAASGGGDDDLSSVSTTLHADQTFTFDDYVAAGWKKSKQFPTDTVPGATDIWYGFYDRKDIEVRFYNSHDDAKTLGVESASAAIDQKFREGGQVGASNRGAGSAAVTKYKAFAVIGNTVILCELNVDTCTGLANALESS